MTQELLRDDRLPYREYIQRPGEALDYAIEWTNWLANRWLASFPFAANVAVRPVRSTGFQYIAQNSGLSGNDEPEWPTAAGQSVVDGSITWLCQLADAWSLATTVASSAWSCDAPLTVSGTLAGNKSSCIVTVPAGTADGDYYVRNTVTLANTLLKIGTMLLKVRSGKA